MKKWLLQLNLQVLNPLKHKDSQELVVKFH